MQPKLQIALDVWTLDEAFKILEEVADYVDIIEAGTSLVVSSGIDSLNIIKEKFPDKEFVIDAKITDEFYIAKRAFEAGADYTTVLGILSDESVASALNEGGKANKEVIVDLMNVKDKVERAKQVQELGAEMVIVHCGIDEQLANKSPLAELRAIKKEVGIKVAVAGGITLETLDEYIHEEADVVIVGGALVKNSDRGDIAAKMREKIQLN